MIKKLLLLLALLSAGLAPAGAQFADQANFAGTGAGTANAQTVTLNNVSSYADLLGVPVSFIPGATNTTTATFQVNSLAATAVRKPSSGGLAVLSGNEFVTGQTATVIYDGTFFVIVSSVNSTIQNVAISPQGYLTPCQVTAGSPVSGCAAGQLTPTGDVVSTTVLYYEPVVGNQIPIYNGANLVPTTFSELTLTIPSSRLANTIYDVCVFSNAGTPTAAFSVAWTTSSAGSGARGSGAGTAQIGRTLGVWTNSVAISAVNGASTFSVPANQCTIAATVLIDGVAGQTTFHRTFGQSRKWAAWNFYNRLPIYLKAGDGTATWSCATCGPRPANNNNANSLTLLSGLAEETFDIRSIMTGTDVAGSSGLTGIGFNSNSAFGGTRASFNKGTGTDERTLNTSFMAPPFVGTNNVFILEQVTNAATVQFNGTEVFMVLDAQWRG